MPVVQEWLFGRGFKLLAEKRLGDGYQSRLAELLGVKPAAVNQYLSGKHPMSEKTISSIATALGVEYIELTQQAMTEIRRRVAKGIPLGNEPAVQAAKAAPNAVAKKSVRKGKAPSSDIPRKRPAKKSAKAAA
jgi:DNA-binding transcriptional regulator YdaS (Cro superfamily)